MPATCRVALALALVGCGALDEAREDARGVTERHACRARLSCERADVGLVVDGLVCAADPERARFETLAECDALGADECAGSRYWRCDVECEPAADPTPCIP